MRFPDFLVIGAMKSGTTSLFFDLLTQPRVFFPQDKEPGNLADDGVLTEAGKAAYARLYEPATPRQLCGDASTRYAKLPEFPGVARRARSILGADVRIIYLVREPVARTVSQHYHEFLEGGVVADIDRAVREAPRLVDYSRYAMQIRPWLDAFGADQVRVVRFESYVADRRGVTTDLAGFLGIDPDVERLEPDKAYNRGDRQWARGGLLWRFSRSDLYRSLLRPWLSRDARGRLRDVLLRKPADRPGPPSAATVDFILERVETDVSELTRLVGWNRPPWDLEAVRARYHDAIDPSDGGR